MTVLALSFIYSLGIGFAEDSGAVSPVSRFFSLASDTTSLVSPPDGRQDIGADRGLREDAKDLVNRIFPPTESLNIPKTRYSSRFLGGDSQEPPKIAPFMVDTVKKFEEENEELKEIVTDSKLRIQDLLEQKSAVEEELTAVNVEVSNARDLHILSKLKKNRESIEDNLKEINDKIAAEQEMIQNKEEEIRKLEDVKKRWTGVTIHFEQLMAFAKEREVANMTTIRDLQAQLRLAEARLTEDRPSGDAAPADARELPPSYFVIDENGIVCFYYPVWVSRPATLEERKALLRGTPAPNE